jgi:hypothetical protein
MTVATEDAGLLQDARTLVTSYEEVRAEALFGGSLTGRGRGLALFLRCGMGAWLKACAPMARRLDRPQEVSEDRLPPDLRTEIAMVLAEMALKAAPVQGGIPC